MRTILLLMTLTVVLPTPAWSWNEEGHRTVALVAETLLSRQAQAYVQSILQAHPDSEVQNLADSAYWPDRVRSDAEYHQPDWHYTDWPIFVGLPVRPISKSGQSLHALNLSTSTLKTPAASQQEKAVALSWVAHLLGDIHQPLHAASRYGIDFPEGDRGGNKFLVLLEQETTDLHTFWDSAGGLFWRGANRDRLDATVDDFLLNVRPENDAIQELSPLVWQEESHALARDVAYRGVEQNLPLSEEYIQEAREYSQERLILAGYRLAAYLERLSEAASQ